MFFLDKLVSKVRQEYRRRGKVSFPYGIIPPSSGAGDLYVKYLVWIPKKLKSSEKDALESMRQSESFVPNLSREDKNLFDKMKENF